MSGLRDSASQEYINVPLNRYVLKPPRKDMPFALFSIDAIFSRSMMSVNLVHLVDCGAE